MDDKTLRTLEFDKILEKLAGYCSFPASAELALQLRPTDDLIEARRRLAETSEAVRLLTNHADLTIGGARDVRQAVDLANHGAVLLPGDLLDIKYTLISARTLARTFERWIDAFPNLADIISQLPPPLGLIDAISRSISDRGEILDSASVKLSAIRHDLRIAHDRLMTRLQRIIGDPKNGPYLQEALITQRDGRYVVPLRSEFKGRIRSIIHDQSASGATLFVEPLVVVELNNQYRELELAERDEERRILAELSHQVGMHSGEIIHTVEVIARLDLALARGKYAEDLRASEPKLHALADNGLPAVAAKGGSGKTQKQVSHPGSIVRLYQARHPLLDPQTVVPIDVDLDEQIYAMIVTGPNTGGKTVTLKTIGLLALMAQAGLHIPVWPGSEISVFEMIFADIGDEQSIEQSLSTFSGHITNIIHILEQATPTSLVILDELGAGTDPQEGAALARAILSNLLGRGITTLVTTHHPELKAYAHATPGAVNASVEFDLDSLRPTFHLTIGLPGRSNALAIAQRLGLPESIIVEARAELSPDEIRADDLLDEIHHQRELARQARNNAEQARLEADEVRKELVDRLENLEEERRRILLLAQQQADAQILLVQEELADVRRLLTRTRQPAEIVQEIEDRIDQLEQVVEQPVERSEPELGPTIQRLERRRRRAIRLGDRVRLRKLGMQGVVIALGEDEAEIQVGMMRVRTRLVDLELTESQQAEPVEAAIKVRRQKTPSVGGQSAGDFYPASPGMELDLRGQRAEDALEALERYLDAAFLAGMPFVRIIHGKGTGKLREVVRQALSQNAQIKSYEAGGEKEGGDGVTVAKLAT